MNKIFKLSNPYIFWSLILIFGIMIAFNNTSNIDKISLVKKSNIEDRTYKIKKENDLYILDLDKIDKASNIDELTINNFQDKSFITKIKTITTTNNLWLILYTLIISILFIIREKQNRVTQLENEKVEDKLRIILATKETNNDPDLIDGLKNFSNLLSSEFNFNNIETKINEEPKLLIFSSRIIIERLFLELYFNNFNEEDTLNNMIIKLDRVKIINKSISNYAHIIKAFGNKVAHPNIKKEISITSRESKLVLSNLLQLLKEIDENNIMDIKNV